MADYKYGDCSFCGGEVSEKLVMVVRFYKGHLVIIENVPAGVCHQCGERYYRGAVVEEMERLMEASSTKAVRQVMVPVVKFAATLSKA
jgi:YgiT-type zinc finger domain-containing protein